jgi:hypothetical protein
MSSVAKLRAEVHQRTVNFRALDRLVESAKFETAFGLDPCNTRILFAINSGDVYAVEEWMKRTIVEELDLGELSLRELRAKAAQLGITYPALYRKDELIVRIAHVQRGAGNASGMPPVEGQRVDGCAAES